MAKDRLSIAVGIATTGRADTLAATLTDIARQTRLPDRVAVSIGGAEDFDAAAAAALPFAVERMIGPKGLTRQRNRLIEALADEDVLLFLDDDFLMAPDYLARLEELFAGSPGIAIATGHVVADGILGPGLSFEEARAALAADVPGEARVRDVHNAYGCNMAVRMEPMRRHGLRFDERLPLYGWLEDIDFSRAVARYGRSVRASALRGAHLGVKRGRVSGVRLGYSQIVNPVYLVGKGAMSRRHAMRMMGRNFLANLGRALRPEPWVDRRGRLKGNLLALLDLLRGRADPERVLTLDTGAAPGR